MGHTKFVNGGRAVDHKTSGIGPLGQLCDSEMVSQKRDLAGGRSPIEADLPRRSHADLRSGPSKLLDRECPPLQT